jgi:hypothetical protein
MGAKITPVLVVLFVFQKIMSGKNARTKAWLSVTVFSLVALKMAIATWVQIMTMAA